MMKSVKKIIHSRYVHLCLGLLLLYCISWVLTYSSQFEKILDTLCWYCYADYMVIEMSSKKSVDKGRFYRERYAERLNSLTSGLFDWNDEQQAKEFFMSKGYAYEMTNEGKRFRSYVLAPILEKGIHTAEIPQKVTFYYYILDEKEIPTFLEYLDGRNTLCLFVSAADRGIDTHPEVYIHTDSLTSVLRGCFETLWEEGLERPEGFGRIDNRLTAFVSLDLKDLCERVFITRLYRNKREAEKYFVKEGLKVYWPTLLAIAARMALDQDLASKPAYRYLRALFTGLSQKPNYTMFYLSGQYSHYDPAIDRIMKEFSQRVKESRPGEVTLEQISEAAQEMLTKLERLSTHPHRHESLNPY